MVVAYTPSSFLLLLTTISTPKPSILPFTSLPISNGSRAGAGAVVLERPSYHHQGGGKGRVKSKTYADQSEDKYRVLFIDDVLYKVLLIDDVRHTEKLVVKALPEAVPIVTPDDARRLFRLSRENGAAVVIVTLKEHAKFYAKMMMRKGLRSRIEPDTI